MKILSKAAIQVSRVGSEGWAGLVPYRKQVPSSTPDNTKKDYSPTLLKVQVSL